MNIMSIKHLNQRQLAERWNVSESSLERWRYEGIGPVYLKLQGRVRYRLEDIEACEGECLRKSTTERAGEALLVARFLKPTEDDFSWAKDEIAKLK